MKNKTLAIVGSQWGDEGKGKIVDYFAQKADMVVRWSGGNNAGHTIKIKDKKYYLSLIPSGVLNPNSTVVIGGGCVVDLLYLIKEIDYLKKNNISVSKLIISDRAHLIMPYHIELDHAQELYKKTQAIGTTKKGIGPAYQDQTSRQGIRICDLFFDESFKYKLKSNLNSKKIILTKLFKYNSELDYNEIYIQYKNAFNTIKQFVKPAHLLVDDYINNKKYVLFEGAQGVMLDLLYGTYPFVTSSHPTANSISSSIGINYNKINITIGVSKAYNTRVGNGPFVSEIKNEVSDYIIKTAHEFGTVTKRKRRIGWLDAVVLKHSSIVGGYDYLAITLLDILSNIKTLKIVTHYMLDNKKIDYVPAHINDLNKCKPVYITLDGWTEDLSDVKTWDDLPSTAKKYLLKIQKLTGLKLLLFSVGPERNQTIVMKERVLNDWKI